MAVLRDMREVCTLDTFLIAPSTQIAIKKAKKLQAQADKSGVAELAVPEPPKFTVPPDTGPCGPLLSLNDPPCERNIWNGVREDESVAPM